MAIDDLVGVGLVMGMDVMRGGQAQATPVLVKGGLEQNLALSKSRHQPALSKMRACGRW
jgi:hypothetical protein